MKKIVLILFALILTNCGALTNSNEPILVGKIKKQDLLQPTYATWFTPGFDRYQPNAEVVKQLKTKAKGVSVVLYMGTWCSDSQLQVPNFYKVLSQAGIADTKVSIVCVDRNKATPEGTEKVNKITNVPTFIFYKNKKEINRIVESPRVSLEDDMLQILSGKEYKHTYAQ
jgi:thiol-disulfide isomerase/thioredoxin